MNFNDCSNHPRLPHQFARALLSATIEQRLTYAEMTFHKRYRTRRQFYAGHAIACALTSVLNNVSPPAWLDPPEHPYPPEEPR